MKSLKLEHFYYGAILTAILEYNPDSSLALLERNDDNRKIYKIQTSQSKECVIFFKYASEKSPGAQSWRYQFSEQDKSFLKDCYDKKCPTFIYLLCCTKEFKNSEIAVLRYDEYEKVSHKKNFSISKKKNSPYFFLHRSKSLKDDIKIPRIRIEKDFDYLIDDIIEVSDGYFCPICGTEIHR